MAVRVGTSGYSYTAWKGSFFPADLPSSRMLEFYAQKLSTVEINNTFYRMPTSTAIAHWAEQVPQGFVFALKAPRRITHQKQLADCADETSHFLRLASELGEKLGPLLFQLPPFMKKDLTRLRDFLASLPKPFAAAFEFRHESWMDDQVFEALREKNAALCIADTDEKEGQVIRTAKWGYLRLRRSDYSPDSLASWAKRITGEWTQTYVYFKHEEEGKGPKFAADFEAAVNQAA
jgi:uncharacterized protein YecE (DUF72 family)